jgi:hypothetical protein
MSYKNLMDTLVLMDKFKDSQSDLIKKMEEEQSSLLYEEIEKEN